MPFFQVCDTLAFHPKAMAAGNAAMGLWVRSGSWSMQALTNGKVPAEVARMLGTPREAERLVNAGLWVPDGGDYQFHQFNERGRQRTKARVLTDREENAKRQEKWRQDRAEEKAAREAIETMLNGHHIPAEEYR